MTADWVPDEHPQKLNVPREGITIGKPNSETIYGCGHEGKPIILNGSEHSRKLYYMWAETKGVGGTKEQCWECFVEEYNESAW